MKFQVGDIVVVDLDYDPNMDHNITCELKPYIVKIDYISNRNRSGVIVPEHHWEYLTYCVCGDRHRGWFEYSELELSLWNDFQDKIEDRIGEKL